MNSRPDLQRIIAISLATLFFIGLIVVIIKVVPAGLGIDWRLTYRPAALAFLHGQNPYKVDVSPEAPFFAAPWGLIPLVPLALLPTEVGRTIIMVGGLIIFALAAYRLGATRLSMAIFVLSPPVMHSTVNANIEWLPLLGFSLPPAIGLFFVTIKPQTGFAVAIFWFVEAWREGGWKKVVRVFAPVTVAFLISFLLYGIWPLGMLNVLNYGKNYNSSLWPLSIPVGLSLLVYAFQKKKIEFAMPASPCLSPYVLFHAWSSAVVSLVKKPLLLSVAVIGLWIAVLVRLL